MQTREVRYALPRARDPFPRGKIANRRVCPNAETNKLNMKIKYLASILGIAVVGVCCISGAEQKATTNAEQKATTNKKRISAADKAAIKDLLKGADAKNYRVQFDGGKDTAGAKKLTLASVRQAGRTGAGTGAFLVEDDIMICYKGTVPFKEFEGQLGKEKMQRLNTIMAKYR
jgi:hypothetical protein